ncbi:TetR/AcrR family transcriptional regulator [Nocardiopsis valliformis]|uniref:TetR/AcrR family transcriptional regulator n=1 Tax=Nocardiopsis valliformis TaxID=239974 RepID=UPI00034606E8|nr:TetR/AcrR family transcriptional regulator [Nocardiopsis valliformis]
MDGVDTEVTATRRGRPPGDHPARRAELLRAAISVLARESYAGTSLRRVAQRAGCTTGAVTYYFASKKALLLALAEDCFDTYDAMLRDLSEGADLRELLGEWLARTTGDPEFWPVMSQLLAQARFEPDLAEVVERRYARFRTAYTAIIAAEQRRGAVRDDIPAELLADQLTSVADGWMLMSPFEPERFTPDRAEALVDTAVALIAPTGPPATRPGPIGQ